MIMAASYELFIPYVGLRIVGWCWTKWSPTFTANISVNRFYRATISIFIPLWVE